MLIEKCAWCGKVLGKINDKKKEIRYTHGICDDCLELMLKNELPPRLSKEELLKEGGEENEEEEKTK